MVYAGVGRLDACVAPVLEACREGFELQQVLQTSNLDGVEPFGFADGISQPEPDWQRRRVARDVPRLEYDNLTCLGEFLLGYPNEYGCYTDRPLIEPADAAAALPRAEERPELADVGRNGTYLVLRQLSQDVRGFWRCLDARANGDPALRRRLAEAMVGRTLDGTPLAGEPGAPNDFDYAADPYGIRCPLGAHVRRANPRTADLPPGRPGLISRLARTFGLDAKARDQDLVASTRFHRLIRRGREYGPNVSADAALAGTGPEGESGLHFVALGANIGRQFEFVQSAWIMGTRFSGLRSEGDGLLGHRQPSLDHQRSDVFSLPRSAGPDARIEGLPRFATVRGGAYFFLPGIRALRYLAAPPSETSA